MASGTAGVARVVLPLICIGELRGLIDNTVDEYDANDMTGRKLFVVSKQLKTDEEDHLSYMPGESREAVRLWSTCSRR